MEHQCRQIASTGKMNGGAVCGRPQTIIVTKQWAQCQEFIAELHKAVEHDTIAMGSYYPGHEKVMEGFLEAHPDTKELKPEGGKFKHGSFYICDDIGEDGYAVSHEAFTQFFGILQLDCAADPPTFMKKATEFCNTKLLGTLGCMILIDEKTKAANQGALDEMLVELGYGGIAVNCGPPFVFLSCYMIWGGYGEEVGKNFVSGVGNFGNLLCYENVVKAILTDSFMSAGHFLATNRHTYNVMMDNFAQYAIYPTYKNMTKLFGNVIISSITHPAVGK